MTRECLQCGNNRVVELHIGGMLVFARCSYCGYEPGVE